MPRPSNWNHPTTSIRVPTHTIDRLLELARLLDCAESTGFVQNDFPPVFLSPNASLDDCLSALAREFGGLQGMRVVYRAAYDRLSPDEKAFIRMVGSLENFFKPDSATIADIASALNEDGLENLMKRLQDLLAAKREQQAMLLSQ
jgi:hypothetical protein